MTTWIKPLQALFSTLALLTLSACCHLPTRVDVNDHVMYYLKQADENHWATQFHFLTQDVEQVTRAHWDAMSEGKVCMDLSDWSQINKMTSDFCSAQGIDCNYVTLTNGQTLKEALNEFFLRMQTVSGAPMLQIR